MWGKSFICFVCWKKIGKCQIYHGAQCVSTWKVNARSLSAIQPFFKGVNRHCVPAGMRWVLLCSNKYLKWCSGSDQIQPAFSENVEVDVEKKQPYCLSCCLNNLLPEAVPFNRIFYMQRTLRKWNWGKHAVTIGTQAQCVILKLLVSVGFVHLRKKNDMGHPQVRLWTEVWTEPHSISIHAMA